MKIERLNFSGTDNMILPAVLWLPDGADSDSSNESVHKKPRLLLQIAHGWFEKCDHAFIY